MKRHFIDLKTANGMPWGNSYRRMLQFRAFTGGGGAGDEAALLEKVKNTAKEAFEVKLRDLGLQDKGTIESMVKGVVDSMTPEALRGFDPKSITENISKISADLAKIQNRSVAENVMHFADHLDEWFEKNGEELQRRLKQDTKWEMKMDLSGMQKRALNQVMTTTNTTASYGSIAVSDIESFTIGEFIEKRYGVQYIRDVANVTTVTNITELARLWEEEGNVDGGFAIVAENGLKPYVSGQLVWNKAVVKKIAAKWVVTEELAKFKARILAIIERLIRNKLIRDYNALITADLQAAATGYVGTALDDSYDAPNDYQAIGAIIAQIASLNFVPNVIVMHPVDAMRIRLATNANGTFLYPLVTQNGQANILGLTVVESTYQTVGIVTIAERGLFQIEEEAMTIRFGYGIEVITAAGNVTGVQSDFDYNRQRMILEMYFRDWLPTAYTGSIVTANLNTVKAALLKP